MPGKFACASCQREFVWKAELAGKKAKCKCGEVLAVPSEDPGFLPVAAPEDDFGEYGLKPDPAPAIPMAALAPTSAAPTSLTPTSTAPPSSPRPGPAFPPPRKRLNVGRDCCQACGQHSPTKYVEFHQNVGALVVRFHKSIRGQLCKSCIHEHFWKMTMTTLMVGWLGYISIIIAPIFLISNIVRYLGCLTLPSSFPQTQRGS